MNGELPNRDEALEWEFPGLVETGYEIKSSLDPAYNCVAFAVGDTQNWWEDTGFRVNGYYWPPNIEDGTVPGWVKLFELHGYSETEDETLEADYEKVAIYALPNEPTHVARQTGSGVWASKMGRRYDIHHPTLAALTGKHNGRVEKIMKRKCKDGRRVLE